MILSTDVNSLLCIAVSVRWLLHDFVVVIFELRSLLNLQTYLKQFKLQQKMARILQLLQ